MHDAARQRRRRTLRPVRFASRDRLFTMKARNIGPSSEEEIRNVGQSGVGIN
jgi:hypothetical protein